MAKSIFQKLTTFVRANLDDLLHSDSAPKPPLSNLSPTEIPSTEEAQHPISAAVRLEIQRESQPDMQDDDLATRRARLAKPDS